MSWLTVVSLGVEQATRLSLQRSPGLRPKDTVPLHFAFCIFTSNPAAIQQRDTFKQGDPQCRLPYAYRLHFVH